MEPVLSIEEMIEIETLTKKSLKISDIELMAKAGYVLTNDFIHRVKPNFNDAITIIVSIGHNGGDGLAMCLHLLEKDYKPKVILIGHIQKAKHAFQHYFTKVIEQIKVIALSKETALEVNKILLTSKYVIDGIFGSGLKREVSGHYLNLIRDINHLDAIVYAIDFPSGIHPSSGMIFPDAIKADFTGVVGHYKYGNLFNDALDYHGEINCLDIDLVKKQTQKVELMTQLDVNIQPMLRKHHSHKYTYGLGFFIGGSKSMTGAINLSVLAAMRSGLGISQVFQESPLTRHLEVIYQDIDTSIDVNRPDMIVFGPGLIKADEKYLSIYQKINQSQTKAVIDGGGLSYIDINNVLNPHMIITPHLKELSDLLDIPLNEVSQTPLKYVKQLTDRNMIVVLKGQTTIIASKHHIYLYQAKNPGLATAGSGDVLSGVIASFLNDNQPFYAALKGVVLHAEAAQLAKEKYGEVSMLSSDIVDQIHHVIKRGSL